MPEELILGSMGGNASGAFTKRLKDPAEDPDKDKYSETNPFKKKKGDGRGISPFHEGYNKRTLVVNKFEKNFAVYSSNRVVQSQASAVKMQLIEVQRQNIKL